MLTINPTLPLGLYAGFGFCGIPAPNSLGFGHCESECNHRYCQNSYDIQSDCEKTWLDPIIEMALLRHSYSLLVDRKQVTLKNIYHCCYFNKTECRRSSFRRYSGLSYNFGSEYLYLHAYISECILAWRRVSLGI